MNQTKPNALPLPGVPVVVVIRTRNKAAQFHADIAALHGALLGEQLDAPTHLAAREMWPEPLPWQPRRLA